MAVEPSKLLRARRRCAARLAARELVDVIESLLMEHERQLAFEEFEQIVAKAIAFGNGVLSDPAVWAPSRN